MKTITKTLLFIFGCLMLLGIGFYGGMNYTPPGAPTVEASALEAQIADCSELTTSKLSYTGYVQYEECHIPLITKKAFSMTYVADARAGVDLSKAKVNINDNTITVKLPKAETQVIAIDPNSLEFFDEHRALFNWQDRNDSATALEAAQADVESKIDQTALIEEADAQARLVVEDLLAPFTEEPYNFTLVVEQE